MAQHKMPSNPIFGLHLDYITNLPECSTNGREPRRETYFPTGQPIIWQQPLVAQNALIWQRSLTARPAGGNHVGRPISQPDSP
jgi:hypothetical protein